MNYKNGDREAQRILLVEGGLAYVETAKALDALTPELATALVEALYRMRRNLDDARREAQHPRMPAVMRSLARGGR